MELVFEWFSFDARLYSCHVKLLAEGEGGGGGEGVTISKKKFLQRKIAKKEILARSSPSNKKFLQVN